MLYAIVAMGLAVAAEPAWKDLYAPSAESSSFLKSNWNKYTENYHPAYALDDNPVTAWVEGADGDGLGESITIPLSALKSAKAVRLQIRNGYQKSEMLFHANGVPKDVTIAVLLNGEEVASKQTVLLKKMGWQELVIPIPPGRGLDAVKLTIGSIYPGKTYRDTCVSDIKVQVDSDVPYNAAFEETKRKLLMTWIADRVATAKYFASQPREYPFAATSFDWQQAPAPEIQALDAQLGPFRAAAASMKDDPKWYRAEYAGKPLVWPDGLAWLDTLDRVIQPSIMVYTEAPDGRGRHESQTGDDGGYRRDWSAYKVRFANGPGSAVQAVYFTYRAVEEGRGTYVTEQSVVVQYDDKQRPTFAYVAESSSDEMGGTGEMLPGETLYVFEQNADGRIVAVRRRSKQTVLEWPEGDGEPKKVVVTDDASYVGQ